MHEMAKRKVDELGRIALPVELRRALNIDEKDELSICIKDCEIVIKKAQSSCIMCEETDNLTIVENKYLCLDCISKIKKTVLP